MLIKELYEKIHKNISLRISGKDNVIDRVLIAVIAGGHVLLDDVPGTGKTTLAKALASSVDGTYSRVQFTPDLLPTDITGVNVYDMKKQEFSFRKGAVFTNILLADEINRAAPRTQSALLECMEEKQVTADGVTFRLPEPFLVIATQNPVELQGTFPLPEAQLDRFLFCLRMGYPERDKEKEMLSRALNGIAVLRSVASCEDILNAQKEIQSVRIADAVQDYLLDIAKASREHSSIKTGLSPRGLLALADASRGYAAIKGRGYVTPDDVKAVAADVMAHRLILKGASYGDKLEEKSKTAEDILEKVSVPKDQIWNC